MDQAVPLPLACPDCAAHMPETAAFCPGCGRSMAALTTAAPAVTPVVAIEMPEAVSAENATVVSPTTTTAELIEPPVRAQGKVGPLPENIAGALAYITCIPAIVFLVLEPYKNNRFARFHSIQCLLLWVVGLALAAALKLISIVLLMIPLVGFLLLWLVYALAALAGFVLWLVLIVKALQGELFKLPVLGDFAEQHAGLP